MDESVRRDIPKELIEELAVNGGVCDQCGGVHVPSIDSAILLLTAERESGIEVPHCSCGQCPVCSGFRTAVNAIARSQQEV
jgi:hypothetical protein